MAVAYSIWLSASSLVSPTTRQPGVWSPSAPCNARSAHQAQRWPAQSKAGPHPADLCPTAMWAAWTMSMYIRRELSTFQRP
eukprot:1497726-Pyramimonas_sp.AAC.1